MSSTIIHEDLRIIKTKRALCAALSSLLKKGSFNKITVKELCEEALISRATFYAHFIDKYELLKEWLTELWPKDFNHYDTYEQIETAVNCYIYENRILLKHLVSDAEDAVFRILFDFILSTINLRVEKDADEAQYLENVVLSNFFAGGMISYFLWQIENRFPPEVPPMNRALYDLIHAVHARQAR